MIQQARGRRFKSDVGKGAGRRHQGFAGTHTKAAYSDPFQLLLGFAERATGIAPSALTLADLDADLIGAFLQHLETERGNSPATRNTGRVALRSFFTYASCRAPDATATIGEVLAIPAKRAKTTHMSVPHHPRGRSPHRCPGHHHLARAP